jgi:hypothetical protein
MKFLFTNIQKHPIQYVILTLGFGLSLFFFYIYRFDRIAIHTIVYLVSGFYFVWSLYHHYRHGDLHPIIVLEYLLIIALVISVATL